MDEPNPNIPEWQDRVINERDALVEKIQKLHAFIEDKEKIKQLLMGDYILMVEQLDHMRQYRRCLEDRIARF